MSMEAPKTRPRCYSKVHPELPVHHKEGLDFLLYRLGKEAVGGCITKDVFVNVVDEVVMDIAGMEHRQGMSLEELHVQLQEVFNTFDKEHCGKVPVAVLSTGLHVILEGTEEEKIDFAFKGLDHNGDGKITKEEFLDFFKHYFMAKCSIERATLSEERWRAIKNHLEMTFRASDTNKDGTVDVTEFIRTVKTDPDHPFCLVLDSFGALTAPLKSPRAGKSPGLRPNR
eukprot:TRINITY_DN389_c1_g1_i5.p2 TRINITY_DN389_c1_g1~~TRINITY_DN389_c1_g1_i5.p2  ORF type:complete len:227 (+),score=62.59 TRINITY_DN389_c1_g1_i5:41-721(+)